MHQLNLPDDFSCCGCMACVAVCPNHALQKNFDRNGFLRPRWDASKCVFCGLCQKTCPVFNSSERKKGDQERAPLFFAGWSKNSALRKNGSTSGVFGTLAATILKEGGIVAGAVQEQFDVRFHICETLDELPKLQGSKYQQSDPTSIYGKVKRSLEQGDQVLFSGLPCQIAALRNFLGPLKDAKTLHTVDLICGGVPSKRPLELFRKLNPQVSAIENYRDKQNGWKPLGFHYDLLVRVEDGSTRNDGHENILSASFSSKLFHRKSCRRCLFAKIRHESDLTIGDLWGDQRFPDEHFSGVSLIAVNNKKGYALLKRSNIAIKRLDGYDFLLCNSRFCNRFSGVWPFWIERKLAFFALRVSEAFLKNFLLPFIKIDLLFFKIRCRLTSRLRKRRNGIVIKSLQKADRMK